MTAFAKLACRPALIFMVGLILTFGLTACDKPPPPAGYTGYIEAEFVYVAAPDVGWIVKAPVREGDKVAVGDLLFELDADRQLAEIAEASNRLKQAEAEMQDIATGARSEEITALTAKLKEAEAALQLAEVERTRWTELVRRGVASAARADQVNADYEAALARVRTAKANISVARLPGRTANRDAAAAKRDAAEASLAQAKWRFAQRTVAARVSGQVEEVFHRVGEFVTTGSPVLALLPPDAMKARFFVPQADLSRIAVGASVNIIFDGQTTPLTAHVTYIAREAEFTPPVIFSAGTRTKLVFLVEAHLDFPGALRPGLPVDVRLP